MMLMDRHKQATDLANFRHGLVATLLAAADEDGEKPGPLDWFKPREDRIDDDLRKLKRKAREFNRQAGIE